MAHEAQHDLDLALLSLVHYNPVMLILLTFSNMPALFQFRAFPYTVTSARNLL